MRRLKVGFMIDGRNVRPNLYRLISEIKQDERCFAEPVLVILNREGGNPTELEKIRRILRKGPSAALQAFLRRIVRVVETRRLRREAQYSDYGMSRNLRDLHLPEIVANPKISKTGNVFRYDAQSIEQIRRSGVDVLVRCGSGILKGSILTVCPFGILSFHHGDNRVNRGGPSGFWETYNNEPASGFIIQRLTEEIDGGHVLFRGSVQTRAYWTANSAQLRLKSDPFMLRILRALAASGTLPEPEPPLPYSSKLYLSPSAFVLIKYLARNATDNLRNLIFQKLLNYKRRWGVAYVKGSGLNAVMFRAKVIPNPPRTFLADPFVVERAGRNICFLESYNYDEKIGKISAYEITEGGCSPIGKVLDEEFHLAFPFVFDYDGKLFMCPDTSKKNEIRLYICEKFPEKWSYFRTIMTDISAVDTMIIPIKDKWYMFTNICSSGISENTSELHIFMADTPLSEDWKPNVKNPVIFDAMRGRNGGMFVEGDRIFRVNQVHQKATYGSAAQINLITGIDQSEYSEERVCGIEPNFFDGLSGTHHFHSNGSYCVFDFCRYERLPR